MPRCPPGAGGAPSGSTTPHSPSLSPPTGLSGIGTAIGAVDPGAGASERSIAGAGLLVNGQLSVLGVVNGASVVVVGGGGAGWAPATPEVPTTPVNAMLPESTVPATATAHFRRHIIDIRGYANLRERPNRHASRGIENRRFGLYIGHSGRSPLMSSTTTQSL